MQKADLKALLELYTQLTSHGKPNKMPIINETIETLWDMIYNDKNYHIIVGFKGNTLISSCVIVIVPNLTHNQRPYALIENVVTDEKHRGKGYATAILNYAKEIAINNNCYKIMLLTGAKKESTLKFYEKAGYNSKDKTAFVQWL